MVGTMDKKNKTLQRLLVLAVLAAVVFAAATAISSHNTYKAKRQSEKLDTVDVYAMHEYSEQNSAAVMKALASGDSGKLTDKLIYPEGAAAVMEFADWKKADFDNAVSMGSGSLDAAPNENGDMEISERFFVDIEGTKYVLFIETATSRWGRNNDGVSAVGVTSYKHFDELDWNWNGESDDSSVLAGKLLWNAE